MRAKAILLKDGDAIPICGRCLIVVNATISVRAKHPSGRLEICETPTEPVALKVWVIGKCLDDPGWWFEIGSTGDRFIPIATMYGDPVCSYDLYRLVDSEIRRLR
jgi:hypothetical protein